MEEAIIAIGSNLGDRHQMVVKAGEFLHSCSINNLEKSSIWESEPIGGAQFTFYNSVAKIKTSLTPHQLLNKLKQFEQDCGRDPNPTKWSPRVLDLDIICYGNLVMDDDNLIIPHPEYKNRLFVLYPIHEIDQTWRHPKTNELITDLIQKAPDMDITKKDLQW